jgi:hypothetical protein
MPLAIVIPAEWVPYVLALMVIVILVGLLIIGVMWLAIAVRNMLGRVFTRRKWQNPLTGGRAYSLLAVLSLRDVSSVASRL